MKITYTLDGNNYEVSFENLEVVIEDDLYADDVAVYVNGERLEDFGESFVGQRYLAEDVLKAAVLAFINNNAEYGFTEVPDKIRAVKDDFFETLMDFEGRAVPKRLLGWLLSPLPCQMVSKDGCAAYTNGDSFVLTDRNGRVLTDMENFYEEGLYDMYEAGYLYIEPALKKALDSME